MDVTGWITGQVFLQTVDEAEVALVTEYLTARGLASQIMTLNEEMVLDPQRPDESVSTTRFSVMVQVAGFPQMVAQSLSELMQRAHGGGWQIDPAA